MSKDFVEMRFRNGEVSGRVRLHRMVGADEVPTILHGALHGLELGRAAAGAWARGGAADVDAELREAAAKPSIDHHARAFWRVALQGLPEHSQADGRLYFHAGEDGMLGVTPLHNAASVFCHNTKTGKRRGHYLYIDNSIDDIRGYILWALHSAGIVVATPYGWPVVPDLETPPNAAGVQFTNDVEGPDADGFEEV